MAASKLEFMFWNFQGCSKTKFAGSIKCCPIIHFECLNETKVSRTFHALSSGKKYCKLLLWKQECVSSMCHVLLNFEKWDNRELESWQTLSRNIYDNKTGMKYGLSLYKAHPRIRSWRKRLNLKHVETEVARRTRERNLWSQILIMTFKIL